MQRQGGGSDPVCGSCPFPGTGYCDFYAKGGGCGCSMKYRGGSKAAPSRRGGSKAAPSRRGGSKAAPSRRGGSKAATRKRRGGYRPTKKNLKYLKKWRKGESIGFTMTSSLKAKGLIPRTGKTHKGKRVVSKKYQ